jgi:arginine-tRNA-protein transferase
MILYQEPRLSAYSPCAYLSGKKWRFEYFFASELNGRELDEFLRRGWRKFGEYYFRPCCGDCRECVPIRVMVGDYRPTKSQRRTARKCLVMDVRFTELVYRDEIFEIYRDHSMRRFGKESDPDEFITAFYTPSCPSLQSEYYLDGELVAVGFLDRSDESLSSVYFIYKTAFERFGLGIYGAMREIEYAANQGLKYYYLGYWIKGNGRMAYKGSFQPNERYDWDREEWRQE